MTTLQESLTLFNNAIKTIYSLDYQGLRQILTALAVRENKKPSQMVSDYSANSLRSLFVDFAKDKFEKRNEKIIADARKRREKEQSKQKKTEQISRAKALKESILARIKQGVTPAVAMAERKLESAQFNALLRGKKNARLPNDKTLRHIFVTHVPRLNQVAGSFSSYIDVVRMTREIFPLYANELRGYGETDESINAALAELAHDTGLSDKFKAWFLAKRLNPAVYIPANKNLFMQRQTLFNVGERAFTDWSVWKQPGPENRFLISSKLNGFDWWTSGWGMGNTSDPFEFRLANFTISGYLVEPKRASAKFTEIGYNFYNRPGDKNCLVRILSPFVQPKDKTKFDQLTQHLIHMTDAPAYIDEDLVDRLGKLLRIKVSLYSPYGALKDTPTSVLGSAGNKKNFKIIVQDRHARVIAPNIVNEVNYINDVNDYINAASNPNMSAVFEEHSPFDMSDLKGTKYEYFKLLPSDKYAIGHDGNKIMFETDGNISGFITVDGFGKTEAKTTMHKFLRPSTITNMPDDDKNPALFSKTSPSAIFLHHFIRKHNLTTPPKFVQQLASLSGRPFGTAYFSKTAQSTKLIEIDQNASYASYEFSPFYDGFPMGNYTRLPGKPTEQPDPELKPAFVEISSIRPRLDTKFAINYLENLSRLRENFTAITYPEYKRYTQMFDIDVVATTYASFQRISLYDDLNEITARMQKDCPNADAIPMFIKCMRNSFTGRLIAGGLNTYKQSKILKTTSFDEFEIMVAEHEKEFGELPRCEVVDNFGIKTYILHTEIDRVGHRYPHIYAYITAISRLSVLEKLAQLQENFHKITRVHVDAIYVRKPSKKNWDEAMNAIKETIPDIGINPGQFKVIPGKSYAHAELTEPRFNSITSVFTATFSTAQPPAVSYPAHRKIVVTGPGGVGKSYCAVNHMPIVIDEDGRKIEPDGRALYLVPTRELRGQMRDDLAAVNKDPSDCVCVEGIRRAIVSIEECARKGKTPPPMYVERLDALSQYSTVFIDEFVKTDGADLLTVIEYLERLRVNIIMMGDYNQTIFAMSGLTMDRERLLELGFYLFADPRNARAVDKPARHSYEWGTFLDSIAELPSNEQVEKLVAWGVKTVDSTAPIEPEALIYCGTWAAISSYNGKVIKDGSIKRVRNIRKCTIHDYTPDMTPRIWNKSAFMEDTPMNALFTVNHAITIDSVQGSTVENPTQYIHVESLLNRSGAIYTAVTRSRTPQQITLII